MDDAAAKQHAPAQGPRVWLDMDQAQLDAAYDQANWASNQAAVQARRIALAGEAYARLAPKRLAYGATPIEGIDYYAGKPGAPLLVFIHGGAWRTGLARDFAHLADGFLDRGAHVAMLDFVSIDDAAGDLRVLARQTRAAVAHLWREAGALGFDAARLYVCGHSSGAHLTSCVATTDWTELGLPPTPLAGVVTISGMYDLAPVRLSARSKYVAFTDDTVEQLSAMRRLSFVHCPIVVAHGLLESPEFQRQSREFSSALQQAGRLRRSIALEGTNHFEILEALHNPHAQIGREVRAMMGL